MAHQVPDSWGRLFDMWRAEHQDELERRGIVDVIAMGRGGAGGDVDVYFVRRDGDGFLQCQWSLEGLFELGRGGYGAHGQMGNEAWVDAITMPLLYRYNVKLGDIGVEALVQLSKLEGLMADVWARLDEPLYWTAGGTATAMARKVMRHVLNRSIPAFKTVEVVGIIEMSHLEDTSLVALRTPSRAFNIVFRDMQQEYNWKTPLVVVVERTEQYIFCYMAPGTTLTDQVSDLVLKLCVSEHGGLGGMVRRGSDRAVSEALRFMYSTSCLMWLEKQWRPKVEQEGVLPAEYDFFDDGVACVHTVSWRKGDEVALAVSLEHSSVEGAEGGMPSLRVTLDIGNHEAAQAKRLNVGDIDMGETLARAGASPLARGEM